MKGPSYLEYYKLITYANNGNNYELLKEWADIYGNKYKLFNLAYVVNCPHMIKDILKNNIKKPLDISLALSIFTKYNTFTLNNEEWRLHRKILVRGIKNTEENFYINLKTITNKMLKVIDKNKDEIIDLKLFINSISFDFFGLIAFSYNFNTIENILDDKINKDNDYNKMKEILKSINDRLFYPSTFWWLLKDKNTISKNSEYFKKKVKEVLLVNDENNKDILSLLKNSSLEENHIIDEILLLFIAGSESTSELIVLIFMHLLNNKNILKKLINKIDNNEDWENYLICIIKETNRISSITPLIVRTLEQNYEDIPKNSAVILNLESLYKNKNIYHNPNSFIPERFENNNLPYFHFGYGKRICPGEKIAISQIKILIKNILQNYDVEMVPNQTLKRISTLSTGLKNFKIIFRDR